MSGVILNKNEKFLWSRRELLLNFISARLGRQMFQLDFADHVPLSVSPRLTSSSGRFIPKPFTRLGRIEIALFLWEKPNGAHEIIDTIKHELLHAFLYAQGRPYGHSPEFRRLAKRLCISQYANEVDSRYFNAIIVCENCGRSSHLRSGHRRSAIWVCRSCWGPDGTRRRMRKLDISGFVHEPYRLDPTIETWIAALGLAQTRP